MRHQGSQWVRQVTFPYGTNQLCYVQMKAVTSIYACWRIGPKKLDGKAISSVMPSLRRAGCEAVY